MNNKTITYQEIFSDSKYAEQVITKSNGDLRTENWYYRVTLYASESYYFPFVVKAEFGRFGDQDNNTTWSVIDDHTNQAGAIRSVIKDIDCYTFPFPLKVDANV